MLDPMISVQMQVVRQDRAPLRGKKIWFSRFLCYDDFLRFPPIRGICYRSEQIPRQVNTRGFWDGFRMITPMSVNAEPAGTVVVMKCSAFGPAAVACASVGAILHELVKKDGFGPNGELMKLLRASVNLVAANAQAAKRESGDISKVVRAATAVSIGDIERYGIQGGPKTASYGRSAAHRVQPEASSFRGAWGSSSGPVRTPVSLARPTAVMPRVRSNSVIHPGAVGDESNPSCAPARRRSAYSQALDDSVRDGSARQIHARLDENGARPAE